MKALGGVAAFATAAALTFWCGEVEAYRPFDGTDAAVAETGEIEIELGPLEYLRERGERSLLGGLLSAFPISSNASRAASAIPIFFDASAACLIFVSRRFLILPSSAILSSRGDERQCSVVRDCQGVSSSTL